MMAQPFNADAVEWNIERWRDPDNEYRYGRTFEYYAAEFGEDLAIEEVNVIDDIHHRVGPLTAVQCAAG